MRQTASDRERTQVSIGFSIPYQPDMLRWDWEDKTGAIVRAVMLALVARMDGNDRILDMAKLLISSGPNADLITKCKRAECRMVKKHRDSIRLHMDGKHEGVLRDMWLQGYGKVAYSKLTDDDIDAGTIALYCHSEEQEMNR